MFVVLPSEPVDTTSFYKERPTPGPGGRPIGEPTRDYRTRWCPRTRRSVLFGFTTHGIRSPRCKLSAGVYLMQVSKWLGHSSYVLTLSTYADYIREDDTAAPNSHVRLQQSRITWWT